MKRFPIATIIVVGSVLFFPFLGSVNLFDWDEANFAEIAREMIASGNYLQPQINFMPFYEKPPLFIWFQVISMKIFGVNEFAARFPNALLGILTMISLFKIGEKVVNKSFGYWWTWVYIGSLLPFLYFRTGLIDPWFNYFMLLSIYFYWHSIKFKNWFSLLLSAFSLGLAVQTKGPAAMIIVYITFALVWMATRFQFWLGFYQSFVWLIFSILLSGIWFAYETFVHGSSYLREFVLYQIRLFTTEDALHGGPIYYHVLVLLFGCFPASFLLFRRQLYTHIWGNEFGKLMIINGLWVLVLFSIVQTKIIHYSSMAYFSITFIATWNIVFYQKNKERN